MREKDDSARGKILEAAKAEFLERGYAEASMRTIAERASFTTGIKEKITMKKKVI